MVYVDDHKPKHVHVKISGEEVVLLLDDELSVKEQTKNIKQSDIRKAQRIGRENIAKLLAGWERIHGK